MTDKTDSKSLEIGDKAPDFNASTTEGDITLSSIDKNVVLYFYPKDDTPGCTTEAKGFAILKDDFAKLDTIILGVSKDNNKSHHKFIEKCGLNFTLIADKDTSICKSYHVWGEKKFMGRKYMGISRETFLIGKDKKIKQIWHNVKVNDHPREVLEAVRNII